MPKKYFKKFLPSHETVKQSRWIRPFGAWLHHPNLWHLHRRSVAGGVAIGMFCGLIPGPFQMIGAALLAVLFRANLPVAMFTTLYTNPITIVPLYVLAYELGAFVTGQHNELSAIHFALPEMSWGNWYAVLSGWIISLGKPFAVGLPLLAVILAVIGYFAVRMLWYAMVVWEWRRRAARRRRSL
ncbi:MAG: DUF2062 domain-containing protein [Gallionellaceae bacterium]|nr:DUF2062 domain-containing protein [Gallionellaceae bacterium]